jgi:hypothetical protein
VDAAAEALSSFRSARRFLYSAAFGDYLAAASLSFRSR